MSTDAAQAHYQMTDLQRTDPALDESDLAPDCDARQTHALMLAAQGQLSHADIASATGYASQQAVSRFLSSDRGRAGLVWCVQRQLAEAGALGLAVAMRLARGAKSEKVMLDAAITLMDRAGLSTAPAAPARAEGGITININGGSLDQGITIEGQAEPITSL